MADLLPGIGTLDVPLRTQAMKILALYAMSYTPSLLPKDIPAADGSAPAVQFPYASGKCGNQTDQEVAAFGNKSKHKTDSCNGGSQQRLCRMCSK